MTSVSKSSRPFWVRWVFVPFLVASIVFTCYVALFHNDAVQNVTTILDYYGRVGLYVFNVFLLTLVVPVALRLMETITGEIGLERFKRVAAISIGVTTLSFAALQFIGAIATSSAEGATVLVEIIQQIAHFSQYGELEQYGLVGMLTSDASGPWNSSIFPIIILSVWFMRRKYVGLETKQLHVPMFLQFVLYAQQFLFGLDLKYTLLEIILMGITGSLFVWGMLSFLIPMFKEAEKTEEQAAKQVKELKNGNNHSQKVNKYWRFVSWVAMIVFKILTFNPWNRNIDKADKAVQQKKGGFGQVGRSYVITNALQLTAAMTVAMFALVLSMQFIAVQIKMSDAEAALFGTAGLTSAPEAFVALTAGPYVNALLLVGSNIIDGWMSAIGQTVLLSYAEIMSHGEVTSIPLHPAIRFLTFLSWTQGMMVWAALTWYAQNIVRSSKKRFISLATIFSLIIAVVYYFGGAWFSAQALGYQAEYAQNSFIFKTLNAIVTLFANSPAQQVTLIVNFIGLGALAFWWTGVMKRIQKLISTQEDQTFDQVTLELKEKIGQHLYREDQQVIVVLDTSAEMDAKGKFFANKWIDLVFRQAAALGLIMDDDGHIPVYVTQDDQVTKISQLLTSKNSDDFIEKYVGRHTKGKVKYRPALEKIYQEYKQHLTEQHDPVLVLFITSGSGTDKKQAMEVFKKMEKYPIFVQFLEIHGNVPHKNTNILKQIEADPGIEIDNSGLSSLPLFRLTDASQIVSDVLNEYPEYLQRAVKAKLLKSVKD